MKHRFGPPFVIPCKHIKAFLCNRVLKTRAPVYHLPVCARAPIQGNTTSVHYPPRLRPEVSFDKHTTLTQIRLSLSGRSQMEAAVGFTKRTAT
jgi:hypothetical protein